MRPLSRSSFSRACSAITTARSPATKKPTGARRAAVLVDVAAAEAEALGDLVAAGPAGER